MKKKWLRLLVITLSLAIAIVWTREASWRKQENRFHRTVHEWLKIDAASTRVYRNYLRYGDETSLVYFDESADELLKIDEMKLIASRSPRPLNKQMTFIAMTPGHSVGETEGFYLAPDEDRGWIEIPQPGVDSWKKYELAPETCRALKQRIGELGKKRDIEQTSPPPVP
ncbi:hypothetical protein EON80_05930 [bacterium]|nr:MAG: hypothetical protein EON80_05930 [bacterium]